MATEEFKHNSTENNISSNFNPPSLAAAVAPAAPTSATVPTTLPPYPEVNVLFCSLFIYLFLKPAEFS